MNNKLKSFISYVTQNKVEGLAIFFLANGILLIFAFILLYIDAGYISLEKSISPAISSDFGDLIGGVVGSIFSITAVLLIWVTYKAQKKELHETQEVLFAQQFETTFFNLLQTQRVLKKSIKVAEGKSPLERIDFSQNTISRVHKGDDALEFFCEELKRLYQVNVNFTLNIQERDYKYKTSYEYLLKDIDWDVMLNNEVDNVRLTYRIFFEAFHSNIGHYMRFSYHILSFLSKTYNTEVNLNPNKKKILWKKYKGYADILQAQMNVNDLFLLFYNGLCFKNAYEKINEFKVLDNLNIEELINKSEHSKYYSFQLKSRDLLMSKEGNFELIPYTEIQIDENQDK